MHSSKPLRRTRLNKSWSASFRTLWLSKRRVRRKVWLTLGLFLVWTFVTLDSTMLWLIWWTISGGPSEVDASLVTNCSTRNYSLPLIVVIPLIAAQTSRLQSTMTQWVKRDLFPCKMSNDSLYANRPALSIFFDRPLHDDPETRRAVSVVRQLLTKPEVAYALASCFSTVSITSANLTMWESRNTRWISPLTSLVSTGGSNAQFEAAFTVFGGKRYRHMFLMEPDTWPIRANWLDAINTESTWGDFWVRGSVMHYPPRFHIGWQPFRERYLRHLNGNAIYALDDPCYASARRLARETFGDDKAFDVAMEFYLLGLGRIMTYQAVAHRFQICRVVANTAVSPISLETARNSFEGTFLVHGKYDMIRRERRFLG